MGVTALLLLFFAQIQLADAATFTVTNTNDSGPGSLRQAVLDANVVPGADTVTFGVTGTITLKSGELVITDNLTIDGPGAASLTISGNNASRVLTVGSSGVTLNVDDLTIADGSAGAGNDGGGIFNFGTVTLTDSTFSGNSGVYGGAIQNFFGTVTVINSTFSGNSAGLRGGGINNYGTAIVTNSTFSGNTAGGGGGGGISSAAMLTVTDGTFSGNSVPGGGGGGVDNCGTATVSNSTFSGNSAEAGGGIINNCGDLAVTNSTFSGNSAGFFGGGGIGAGGTVSVTNSTFSGNSAGDLGGGGIRSSGAVTLRNTIVANSLSGGNCSEPIIDGGGNLSWPDSTCPGINQDPLLDPAGLQDNGGPTKTIALQPGSPAIDAAVAANCPATDQRGVSRPQGAGCDIGAFELEISGVVTNTNDSGLGSLRAAIEFSNTNPGPDTVVFAIPPTDPGFNGQWFTIRPTSQLPLLTDDGTTIDGSTQTAFAGNTNPSGPEIELNGSLAPSGTDGIVIPSSSNHINALVINGFRDAPGFGDGINIGGSGNIVTGCFIGVDPTGSSVVANGNGVELQQPGAGNRIGGTSSADRNVLSGNLYGAQIHSDGNFVQGNFIGTDAAGTAALGNGSSGVLLNDGAAGNVIGGPSAGEGNVISANQASGVFIGSVGGANANTVEGNKIGTDVTGAVALGNGEDGVRIVSDLGFTANGNTIKANLIANNAIHGVGLFSSNENVIQGNRIKHNGDHGVSVGGGPAGTTSTGNVIGGTGPDEGNVISGNEFGVAVNGAKTTIQGNLIGTDASGATAVGNQTGIGVAGSTETLIGGTTAGARNVISGNTGWGVDIAPGSSDNLVQGNYIGTDATGSAPLGNAFVGVAVGGADNLVGGTTPEARNVISGNGSSANGGHGVSLGGTNNRVQGNYIGTNATGTAPLGNFIGLIVFGASNGMVGGTAPDAGNVISGNTLMGLQIHGNGTTGTLVQGNLIGTDASGTAALGNGGSGVLLFQNATGNTIGGTSAAARNVISGNGTSGVQITGAGTTGNLVQGNSIGTDAVGTANLGNSGHGVEFLDGAHDNTVGGTAAGAGNVIAFNGGPGVFVSSGTGNALRRNSIFSDGGLGIDLAPFGVTPNDRGDVDAGPNNLQNYPVIVVARLTPLGLRVTGHIDTPNPQTAKIEIFANRVPSPGGDPSGHGEGAEFLGTAMPSPDGGFTVVLPSVPAETLITATATDAAGNTSEFAANTPARGPGPP